MTAGTVRLQEAGLSDDRSAFGHYALSPGRERLRQFAQGLGRGTMARRACSLIRRIVSLGLPGPFDVEAFPGQRARLYPDQNLSDKRVFAGVQFWDWIERAAIGNAVRASDEPVYVVDAGANAGLYTLAIRAEAGAKALKVLAVEPDPENLKRLKFNLSASAAEADVVVAEVALGDGEGQARIASSHANRGELTVGETGTPVAVRPLNKVLDWAGFPRIDALKIDIEGFELPVLQHFLVNAPNRQWPGIVIMEAHRGTRTEALDLLLAHGYEIDAQTRMNAVLRRVGGNNPSERT
ncbi:MAG: FkbM family methyltransferase [Pseudomonadota bacterium]